MSDHLSLLRKLHCWCSQLSRYRRSTLLWANFFEQVGINGYRLRKAWSDLYRQNHSYHLILWYTRRLASSPSCGQTSRMVAFQKLLFHRIPLKLSYWIHWSMVLGLSNSCRLICLRRLFRQSSKYLLQQNHSTLFKTIKVNLRSVILWSAVLRERSMLPLGRRSYYGLVWVQR